MRTVAVFGGGGFIGSAVVADLLEADPEALVVPVVRPGTAVTRHPRVRPAFLDVARANREQFQQILAGAAFVVNCVGVLSGHGGASDYALNAAWTVDMLQSAADCGVERALYLSALARPPAGEAPTPFVTSRRAAEDILRRVVGTSSSGMSGIVVRASFVYGTGCYGGSETLRLAAGAFGPVLPMPEAGGTRFAPIALPDLARVIVRCLLEIPLDAGTTRMVDAAGPEVMTSAQIVGAWRCWLGLPPLRVRGLPTVAVSVMAAAGRVMPIWNAGPGMLAQLRADYTADGIGLTTVEGVSMTTMSDFLARHPAGAPDRWHARIGFLRPFLLLATALLWAGSGAAGLFSGEAGVREVSPPLRSPRLARGTVLVTSVLDLALAAATVSRRPYWTAQLVAVSGYTLGMSALRPSLWRGLYGPLLKNLPILGLLAVLQVTDARAYRHR